MSRPRYRRNTAVATRAVILRAACYVFLVSGICALGYAGFLFAASHAYQALELKKFGEPGPLAGPHTLAEGDVIGEIQVPRLGLDAMVVQGDSVATLRRAVGHLPASPLPGEPGNVALAGHRDTFFRPLRDVRMGDEIIFKTRERSFSYLVESIEVVAPTALRVLQSSGGHQLTLLTCFPIYYVGPAPNRLVVRARETSKTPREHPAGETDAQAPGG